MLYDCLWLTRLYLYHFVFVVDTVTHQLRNWSMLSDFAQIAHVRGFYDVFEIYIYIMALRMKNYNNPFCEDHLEDHHHHDQGDHEEDN